LPLCLGLVPLKEDFSLSISPSPVKKKQKQTEKNTKKKNRKTFGFPSTVTNCFLLFAFCFLLSERLLVIGYSFLRAWRLLASIGLYLQNAQVTIATRIPSSHSTLHSLSLLGKVF
jgi:hypothetical protein